MDEMYQYAYAHFLCEAYRRNNGNVAAAAKDADTLLTTLQKKFSCSHGNNVARCDQCYAERKK